MNFLLLQVLSWLCKKGEDILSKHAQHAATSLTAARLHEREFEKFYFTSMVSTLGAKAVLRCGGSAGNNGIESRETNRPIYALKDFTFFTSHWAFRHASIRKRFRRESPRNDRKLIKGFFVRSHSCHDCRQFRKLRSLSPETTIRENTLSQHYIQREEKTKEMKRR